jgi:hypothetical protein
MDYPKVFKFLAAVSIEIIAYWDMSPYTVAELEESASYDFRTEC